MAMRCSLLALVLVVGAFAPAAIGAEPKDLVGRYKVEGVNPDKSKYEGEAEIELDKGKLLKVTIKVGKRTDVGMGHIDGDKFVIEYEGVVKTDRHGKAEYEIQKNGVLAGFWKDKGSAKGEETLLPKK